MKRNAEQASNEGCLCLGCLLLQLDLGVTEEVMLMSEDEQVLLVVTYADIKVGPIADLEESLQMTFFCMFSNGRSKASGPIMSS